MTDLPDLPDLPDDAFVPWTDADRAADFGDLLGPAPDQSNTYQPGTLLWIERNHTLNLRAILDSLIAGDCTTEEAAEMLHSLDTDTVR